MDRELSDKPHLDRGWRSRKAQAAPPGKVLGSHLEASLSPPAHTSPTQGRVGMWAGPRHQDPVGGLMSVCVSLLFMEEMNN